VRNPLRKEGGLVGISTNDGACLYKTAFLSVIAACLLLTFLLSTPVSAETVDIDQAEVVVRGWLRKSPRPLDTDLGQTTAGTEAFADDNGRKLYHVVYLDPSGFVIVSADDRIEPIIAFCSAGTYDPSPDNPLGALVSNDMATRMEHLGAQKSSAKSTRAAQNKWTLLRSFDLSANSENSGQVIPLGETGVSDVRVAPLVQSKWDQEDEGGNYCYNYYTPNHYPTGCVATGMAQLMRYHQHPTDGIGVHSFGIYVSGSGPYYYDTIGGNGTGGPYQWPDMPLDPDGGTGDTERSAIGALCYDSGLTVNMSYNSGGSSASLYDAKDALTNATLFDYSNAVFGYNSGGNIGSGLDAMVNSNLDAALPVALSVGGSSGGHVVIADGYGYDSSTLYHHINMGWGGAYDAWYDLPYIDAFYTYTSVDGCVYNLFTSGTGEIISGRVTDMALNPIEGATVTAKIGPTVVKETTTNIKGIYALTNLASSQSFTVIATKPWHTFSQQNVSTGNSSDWQATSGNLWGVNFSAQNATAPMAYGKTVSALSGTAQLITLDAADEGQPNPPGQLSYIITSLPVHGTLTDPLADEITTVPYTLASNGNQVEYTACAYFAGQDIFEFVANDEGISPQGGDSDAAAVIIEIDNHIYTTFEIPPDYTAYWPLDTLYHDHRSQVIYLQSEIGDAKTITDLAINIYTAPGQIMNNWTIRMKHTTMSQYVGFPEFEPTGTGWTVVYQNNEPATPTSWRNFSFQTPFDYNGTDNLLVDFSFNNNSYSYEGACLVSDTGATRVVMASSDSEHDDPLDWDKWTFSSISYSSAIPKLKLISEISAEPVTGDFGLNCRVDMPDLAIFALAWLTSDGQPGYNDECDISEVNDDVINALDLKVFAENWLTTYAP
jgi:hypothetical protein